MNKVQCVLGCGHGYDYVKNRVKSRQSVVCPICKLLTSITTIHRRRWHVRCAECTYSRWFGQDKTEADIAARKHPCLQVQVAYDMVTMDGKGSTFRTGRLRIEPDPDSLLLDTEPPF